MSDDRALISPPFRLAALIGGTACLLLFLLLQFYGFYPEESDLGPTAQVRYTPFHTAGKLLELNNSTVEHFRDLKILKESFEDLDVMILVAKPGHINDDRLQILLDWVEAGGQLIYWANQKIETENDLLLAYLGAQLSKDQAASDDKEIEDILTIGKEVLPQLGNLIQSEQKATTIEMSHLDTFFDIGFNPSWQLTDYSGEAYYFSTGNNATSEIDHKEHLLEYRVGNGTITLFSDLDFWVNTNIEQHDHGFFLLKLIEPKENQSIRFIFAGEHESALKKLQKQAMPLFWLFLLFLSLWLWRKIPRVGPKLTLNLNQRRNISEHVKASSQLRWQQKQAKQWLKVQVDAILKQAVLRNPNFSQLSQEAQAEWLQKIGAIDNKSAKYLFNQSMALELNELQFLELMHQLQQLKNRL